MKNKCFGLEVYSARVSGARELMKRLRDMGVTLNIEIGWEEVDKSVPVGEKGRVNYVYISKGKRIYSDALVDLLYRSFHNMELFLSERYEGVLFTDRKFDKRGNLKSVKANFIDKDKKIISEG